MSQVPSGACVVCSGDSGSGPAQFGCETHAGEFCRSCLAGHVQSAGALPRCPGLRCKYALTEQDIRENCGEAASAALKAFREAREEKQLAEALKQIAEMEGKFFDCPEPGCANRWLCAGERQAVSCHECGAGPFCRDCTQPYHYGVLDCARAPGIFREYQQWVTSGRAAHRALLFPAEAAQEKSRAEEEQRKAVEAQLERLQELQRDEKYKEEHCRLCPHCGRLVEKLEGCNAMRCGYDTDTKGNQQDGCGKSFNWNDAKKYVAPVLPPPQRLPARPRPAPDLDLASVQAEQRLAHDHFRCDLCQKPIFGKRFRCIHCPAFNLCLACEGTCAHDPAHIFEILAPPHSDADVGGGGYPTGSGGAAAPHTLATTTLTEHAGAGVGGGDDQAGSGAAAAPQRLPTTLEEHVGAGVGGGGGDLVVGAENMHRADDLLVAEAAGKRTPWRMTRTIKNFFAGR